MSILEASRRDSLSGFLYATGAYMLWGILPLYMKAVAHMSPVEVIAHRMVWSVPVVLLTLLWLGRMADLKRALTEPRTLMMAGVAAALVSINWGTYVWAIGADHALDAALGYFINPLFSILLGRFLLKERLLVIQWLAIALAGIGVGIVTWQLGQIPVVGLTLTISFGFYAYLKRALPIGPNQGFALEVILLLPVGIGIILWYALTGSGHFLVGSASDTSLLLGCGIVTAVPLILYANGAKRLNLTTIALMQYILPTTIFLIAVFWFREPLTLANLAAFGFIWGGLLLYSISLLRVRPTSLEMT